MNRRWTLAASSVFVVLVAACSSSATPAPSSSSEPASTSAPATASSLPTTVESPAASPSSAAAAESAPPSELPTAVPTALDPCQIVTSDEASQLGGTTFGAGKESTTSGHAKICTYGGQTLNVFTVVVGQAPDVATAKAGEAAAEASIQKLAAKGVKFTQLPDFADGAAYVVGSASISGQTINMGAFYALKGTIFFGFSDLSLGHAAPTSAAMQAQAQTILGRLP